MQTFANRKKRIPDLDVAMPKHCRSSLLRLVLADQDFFADEYRSNVRTSERHRRSGIIANRLPCVSRHAHQILEDRKEGFKFVE